MRFCLSFLVLALLTVCGALNAQAQDANSIAQIENLRSQLRDVQFREADLKTRLESLNFELKPENIERATSGYGSTRPEELRELRRRQLQNEKDAILAQLDQLATSRMRLESAILTAETQAYQQQGTMGKTSLLVHRVWREHRPLVVTGFVLAGILAGMVVIVPLMRRRWHP